MEVLGFLIIVGLLIVFIVRRDLWNGGSSGSKADEVEEASVKMRLQMEHTMNTLITQMDTRIHQIEGLVAAADERARTLESQLAAVREEQAVAQRKAEQEIAAMRAAQNSYYPPRDIMYPADYGPAGRNAPSWRELAEMRARGMRAPLSMQPIGEISSVRRADYAARARLTPAERGDGFAEALSASMQAAERNYGARREPGPAYYENEAYDGQGYDDTYGSPAYPKETYAPAEEWNPYEDEPRGGEPRTIRWPESAPAEMIVDETPAAIVEPNMGTRPEPRVEEEPEEEEPLFTPEQLEELAKTEAEVVVSSSVADVVDLPVQPDEEEEAAYADLEPNLEERILDADDEGTPTAESGGQDDYAGVEDEPAEEGDAQQASAPSAGTEEEAEVTLFSSEPEAETEEAAAKTEEQEDSDADEEASEDSLQSEDEDGENRSAALGDEFSEEEDSRGTDTPSVAVRSDSPAIRARELLEKGMSPEEVTKETGMGRGAIDLLAQMVKSQRKAEDGD